MTSHVSSRFLTAALACGLPPALVATAAAQASLEIKKGDRIAIVGSGLADRQQHLGWLEAMIHKAYAGQDLTIRNLGFAADEVDVHPRSDDVPPLEWFLSMKEGESKFPGTKSSYTAGTTFGADVILAYWGFNESFKGADGLEKFKAALGAWLDAQKAANYGGRGAPRLVLFSPIAQENLKSPDFGDGKANNENLALYTKAMSEVAKEKGVPFVDLFHASLDLYGNAKTPLTINGIHMTADGDKALAPVQFKALFGKDGPSVSDPQVGKIRQAVLDKNKEWHHRYRTVDQYNIYGDRSRIAYEGITNARILNQEMAQRDVKTANRDKRVWAVAKGGDLVVKDDNLPPVEATPPNRKQPVPYNDPEDVIPFLKTPSGIKIELVASEKEFPALVNPVQMNFDTKGRLWISAWKNYPETSPTTTDFDKLLVFDLDPKTGKPTKMTTFADGLNCPTGFQFYKDGVLVMQSPDLWYLRDTDGDGKADWKERVLHGLDAADSHHETNSMCLEPGGAVYLSDGVFHRTNVETFNGPVRNVNGAIYRYEPVTGKFMRHAPYGFANPHGRVFDYWGNDLITDATGNANYFGPAMSGHLDQGAHPGMNQFWNRPSRPCPGTAILTSRHFPDDWQGLFLNTNVISIQGIFRAKITEEGSGIKGETLEHLVAADLSKAPNFRPSGITVAPDGSLYFMDWSQMLIGHLQHHLRDPNRDHQHGRLYRITYEGRPLLVPKKVDGQPVPALLELLKEPENDVRQRAKIELGKHDAQDVAKATKQWIAKLDPKDPKYEHNVLEGLWVHQWHNVVDLDLLGKVLSSPEPRARAQAVRVMGYWRDRVPNALELLKKAAADESPRVRLEAVRVASYFRDWRAADAALVSLEKPSDYYLGYTFKETMRQLKPWWQKALADGEPLADGNPAGTSYLTSALSPAELAKLPKSAFSYNAILASASANPKQRQEALEGLAALRKQSPVKTLLSALAPLAKSGGSAASELAPLLGTLPAAELKSERETLVKLAAAEAKPVRQNALAALITVDGSIENAWAEGLKSSAAMGDLLRALPLVKDATLRAAASKKALPLLGQLPPSLGKGGSGGEVRYVRIELPRTGTLTLAEVEVFADGKNVAREGTAKQSSVAFEGVASRAIDGKTGPDFDGGGQTHTEEGEDNPWWELDLKTSRPVTAVTVYNRKGFEERLKDFTLTLLDENRQVIAKRENLPAPQLSSRIEITESGTDLRAIAIQSLVSLGQDPKELFAALAGLIAKGELVPGSAKAISELPKAALDPANALTAVKGLLAWGAKVPQADRTDARFVETMKVAKALSAVLQPADAATAEKALGSLVVRSIVVKTIPEHLSYDTKRIVVEAGKPFELVFKNPDLMPHNLVFVQPGTAQAIAQAVMTQGPDKLDSKGRSYVPQNDARVIDATRMIEAGKEETLQVTAPAKEGEYEFVCTFPGHSVVMQGKFIVTKDVEGYLKAHP